MNQFTYLEYLSEEEKQILSTIHPDIIGKLHNTMILESMDSSETMSLSYNESSEFKDYMNFREYKHDSNNDSIHELVNFMNNADKMAISVRSSLKIISFITKYIPTGLIIAKYKKDGITEESYPEILFKLYSEFLTHPSNATLDVFMTALRAVSKETMFLNLENLLQYSLEFINKDNLNDEDVVSHIAYESYKKNLSKGTLYSAETYTPSDKMDILESTDNTISDDTRFKLYNICESLKIDGLNYDDINLNINANTQLAIKYTNPDIDYGAIVVRNKGLMFYKENNDTHLIFTYNNDANIGDIIIEETDNYRVKLYDMSEYDLLSKYFIE